MFFLNKILPIQTLCNKWLKKNEFLSFMLLSWRKMNERKNVLNAVGDLCRILDEKMSVRLIQKKIPINFSSSKSWLILGKDFRSERSPFERTIEFSKQGHSYYR